MAPLRASRRHASRLPLIALALLAGCGESAAPSKLPPAALAVGGDSIAVVDTSAPPEIAGPATPLGNAAPFVDEPVAPPDRTSPPSVVRSLEAALDSSDPASLARLSATSGAHERLDADDLARARRDFLLPQRAKHWRRVLRAVDRAALAATDPSSDRHRVRVDVGGALGLVTLTFERRGDTWLIRP